MPRRPSGFVKTAGPTISTAEVWVRKNGTEGPGSGPSWRLLMLGAAPGAGR